MAIGLRLTPATLRVLNSLLERRQEWVHGYELLAWTGLKSDSIYPILMRLAEKGLLEATWEQDPPGAVPHDTCTG